MICTRCGATLQADEFGVPLDAGGGSRCATTREPHSAAYRKGVDAFLRSYSTYLRADKHAREWGTL